MAGMQAGALTFFEPKKAFFTALSGYKDKVIVDAGAGMGHVSEQAVKLGFQMLPIDIMPRIGQSKTVRLRDAESMDYGPEKWLLTCRPDHSGWSYDCLELALKSGAGVFYAGLARNFDCDLGEYVGRETKRWKNVGKEGEELFLFMPDALLPAELN